MSDIRREISKLNEKVIDAQVKHKTLLNQKKELFVQLDRLKISHDKIPEVIKELNRRIDNLEADILEGLEEVKGGLKA